MHHGLGVQSMQTLRLQAWRPRSNVSKVRPGFATSNLDGHAMLGLHLRYPLTTALGLTADVSVGHLPWVNSLRTEGGEVRLAQTDEEEKLGLDYRLGRHWQLAAYAFHRYFGQDERSREDGNVIRLGSHGVGVAVDYRF